MVTMLALGISSGLPFALTSGTLFVWLRRQGVDISTIGLFGLLGTPYALKFLWAPLLDRLPFPGLTRAFGRRRGWLLVTQAGLIGSVVLLGLSDPGTGPGKTAFFAFLVTVFSASQDIVIDAFRIESLKEREQAAGAAMLVGGWRIGWGLVGGAAALWLTDTLSWQGVYMVMAGALLIGPVAVLLSPEPALPKADDAAETQAGIERYLETRPHLEKHLSEIVGWLYASVVAPFADFMKRPGWQTIILFILFFKIGDALVSIMTSPFLVDIGFSNIEIANINKLYGLSALLVGLAIGGVLLNRVGMMASLWICGILQLLSNFVFAVQAGAGHDTALLALTIGFENLASGMGMSVFVAYLSSLCNIAYTATQYALLSSLFAATRTWLTSWAGFIVEAVDWTWFFLITGAAALPGLVLLWLLTRQYRPLTSK